MRFRLLDFLRRAFRRSRHPPPAMVVSLRKRDPETVAALTAARAGRHRAEKILADVRAGRGQAEFLGGRIREELEINHLAARIEAAFRGDP